MTTRRDAHFPATSIGRVQGASIARTASRDNLTTHPLLSAGPSSLSPSPTPETQSSSTPKYAPYTPRQRLPTTSTTAQPPVSVSPQHQLTGGATSKLQLMNLKAAAQGIGLDTACLGWAMLEKLSQDGETEEWAEIWGAITKGKASLLLPLEQSSSQEKITPEFMSDHVVMCDLLSRENTQVVTLSGLRGHLSSETLTFRSSLPPTKFHDITLSSLPPLPSIPPDSAYPSYAVPAHSTSLPIQVRPQKPPLPPRPIPATQPSRLAMPFASLFGGKPMTTPPTIAATLPPMQTPLPPAEDHPTLISAFSISRAVHRHDVMRDVLAALKSELTSTLETTGVPAMIIERVQSFASPLLPFVRGPAGKKKLHDIGASPSRHGTWAVNLDAGKDRPEELAEKFQEFYLELEREIRIEIEKEKGEASEEEQESRVKEVVEVVEGTLSTLFYDRLFLPSHSDDAPHDEALSSHIAALNLLDLGLEHLDVDVGSAGSEIDVVVRACGETLSQLDIACRSPGDKAAVLVAAHKIVVDGLSRLPPIKLSNGDKQREEPEPKAVDGPIVASPNVTSSPDPQLDGDAARGSPEKLSEVSSPQPPSLTTTPSDIHHHTPSPQVSISPVQEPTTVSGDVLLPLLIFAVVKSNPVRLVSHLLFTQRYRNAAFAGGEERYCLINLMAVVEFLENVDLGAVGVGEGVGIVSTADLTPIPIVRTTLPPDAPADAPGSLRGRVEQGVDAIAGSANKVITGVVDSSFGVLRSFLPSAPTATSALTSASAVNPTSTSAPATETSDARWNMGLLRRESGFSIASLVPGRKGEGKGEEGQRELVDVSSRPGSIRSIYVNQDVGVDGTEEESDESDDDDDEEGEEEDESEEEEHAPDARSIRSFESMLSGDSGRARKKKKKLAGLSRKSLTDRLAQVPGLSRLSGTDPHKTASPPITRSSLLLPSHHNRFDSPTSSRAPSPILIRLPAPNKRFMECAEDDLRVSEVGELLREYKRLVECVRAMGGIPVSSAWSIFWKAAATHNLGSFTDVDKQAQA
ncbi:hypothetical protein DEU56DRAFT_905411 [Suillus clintonianus]|uniref:uncharacterized protein n=1 Tax=Suillus clintonianus TaxID=1904413 RepID=UPI001B85E18B|nr:uncharacterized protein DEU56DRAFT_905411 [Suillus clintonianus]KAG2113693.1 hypothetical protein DEU56DRAFT_905411 [Suillus clintonianus]